MIGIETDEEVPAAAAHPAYTQWEAGELGAEAAATAIAHELIAKIEPAAKALEQRRETRRSELGTLLIRVGRPLEVLGRVARWVGPTMSESASVKKLRALCDELREQGAPALDGIAARIQGCITSSERRGYPLIEPPQRPQRPI